MADDRGDERKPVLGEVLEFKSFNEVLAKLDRKELYRHPMLSDPGALGEWLHGSGLGEAEADGLNEHLNDHIGRHPLREALTAGAWFALLRSANDELAPKFYLRVGKEYGTLVSRPTCDGPMVVIVNVREDWPHLPVGVPGVGWSKLKVDVDVPMLNIDKEMMGLMSEAEATGMWIGAPGAML